MTRRDTSGASSAAFERTYRKALVEHVKSERGWDAADRIGCRAGRLGVATLALARIHDRAATILERRAGRSRGSNHREQAFFAAAVAPLEAAHSGATDARAESERLAAALRHRTDELEVARARFALEARRRKALGADVETSARRHRELLERSRLMQQRLRRLSHLLLSAQEEERLRISRDLHDAVGQTLTGINVGLASLKQGAAADSRELADAIALTQQLVERSMKTVHQYAWELRPTLLDDLGLVAALRSYVRTFSGRTRLKVRLVVNSTFDALTSARGTALYRVAQGALSNVERHARATSARLVLKSLPGSVRLEISDNGRSFDVVKMENSMTNRHLGLLVMRERIEMVGGTFSITSSPRNGTTVRADVPLEAAPRD